MQTDLSAGSGLAVVAGDVLALRGTGLAAAETWALLCQAAQALQDLFLSNGGVVGGSRVGPVVTLHTLELTPRGRVLLQLAPPETARAYLPPEYRPGRVYSDTDSEKMWMYSLGRALLDTTPRVAALTGTVSVSPSSALQSVLAAMTEPDPRRRASLMNLLDVISEYCRTRLQSKPFTHIVMDMYREVVKSPQHAARQRMAYQHLNPPAPALVPVPVPIRNPAERQDPNRHRNNYPHQQQPPPHHLDPLQLVHSQAAGRHHQHHQDRAYHSANQFNPPPRQSQPDRVRVPSQFQMHQQHQDPQQQQPHVPKSHHFPHHHPTKGALFKLQSQNSHSHPNLSSLGGQTSQQNRRDSNSKDHRAQFQSQLNVQTSGHPYGSGVHHQRRHHHSRTYSQPIYTRLQHTRSSGNLPTTVVGENHPGGNVYSDPIYAQPVKPFLSSQDVRVNGLSMKPPVSHNENVYPGTTIVRRPSAAGYSHPDIATSTAERMREEVYGKSSGRANLALQRQCSNPQLLDRDQREEDFKRLAEQHFVTVDHRYSTARRKEEQIEQQQNPVSSIRVRSVQGPPKPPRIITSLKKAAFSDAESSKSEPPAKPPRNLIKNGPRARRGRAVQRAPSRLYRAVGGPTRSFNKAQCVGPEFVVRANQPPKTLCVGQTGSCGRIVVIMLTGQRLEVTCDPQKVTAGDLFQAIVQAESLDENFTLGLAVLLAGDFAILPPETKLNKVAPPGWLSSGKSKGLLGLPTSFMLYLRLRFFLPSLRGIRSWISKHLLYLQIRRCILEQQLVCPCSELINLTGLALQAEFGNYNVNEHGCGDYFLLEHYIPESLILNTEHRQPQVNSGETDTLRARLHQSHRDRRGLDSNKAEEMFIAHAQTLADYGSHYYIATVDSKELEKVMVQQRKRTVSKDRSKSDGLHNGTENIYGQDRAQEYPLRGRIEIARLGSCENLPKIPYNGDDTKQPPGLAKSATSNDIYGGQKSSKTRVESCNNNNSNMNNNNASHKSGKGEKSKKKTESNVWLAIHAQGLKLFERGGVPRERIELAQFQWKDIQTLSYSKNCLVVYSKVNGKRCKFKLRMDHRKSYFAFKLTSLHHQFFLRLRSELSSLHGLAKEFGVPMTLETNASPSKAKSHDSKTKIAIANTVKNAQSRVCYPMQLEEYQNKENENPEKDANTASKTKDPLREPDSYSFEEDALYAQVNVRLEPEGESRDTEDESERSLTTPNEPCSLDAKGLKTNGQLYSCPRIELGTETECGYSLPKIMSLNNVDQIENPANPEELYAAINKVGINRKVEFPVPDEVWDVSDVKKSLHKMKTSSLPNYGTSKQPGGYRTPSLPRRLGVKMGTRAIYNSLVQKDTALTDDMESLSLKSDAESSIHSLSGRSTESPLPEAYVLNADIRTDDETFHVTEDESMSASLAARLEELSFAEERILQTIKLERGHGGSIGLQVTEGNDGGVYVQAVSVGGSADMAGNVNKGDRILAINGQNLLHLRYEEALKMLQSSSDTIELVLSQATSRKNAISRQSHEHNVAEHNYLNDIRFDVSSEADTSSVTNKWLAQRTTDGASVQNTSSAYSSAASSAMGNHNANSVYMGDLVDNSALKSASILLNIEDFDVSRTSHAESASTPPVPPRRKKRKAKFTGAVKSPEGTSPTSLRSLERKRLAPPPPPPPPRTTRRVKSHVAERHRDDEEEEDAISNGRPSEPKRSGETSSGSSSRPAVAKEAARPLPRQFEDTDPTPTKETSNGANDGNKNDVRNATVPNERAVPLFETLSRQEPDKYPPLLFTLHDFQNVMANSLPREEDSRTEAIVQLVSSIRESFHESFEHSLDDEESDMCFRVTTTNLPFEKCLDRWGTTFADNLVHDPNRFVFDDYIDRSSKLNIRRSTGPMCYSDFEDPPAVPRLTKVRFVIQSPSSSTPDHDLSEDGDVAADTLENVGPLADQEAEDAPATSAQLREIVDSEELAEAGRVAQRRQSSRDSDELDDVPINAILKTRNDADEIPFEYTCTSIDLVDRGSSDESDDAGTLPKDSLHRSISAESQDRFVDPGYSVNASQSANGNKAETSLTRSETEPRAGGGLALDKVEEHGRRGSIDDVDSVLDASIDFTRRTRESGDTADKTRIRSYSSGLYEDASNNFQSIEDISRDASDEIGQKLTPEKRLIGDQGAVSGENLTINETIIENDRTWVDEARCDSFPRGIDISTDGKVLSVENHDDPSERVSIESCSVSSQEYKRKIFVSESLRNILVCHDWSSKDSEEDSHISEAEDTEAITGSLSELSVSALGESDARNAVDLVQHASLSRNDSTSDEPVKRTVSMPVSIRRNSFLENMLCEDEVETWTGTTSCKVVAAHPKLSSSVINEEPIPAVEVDNKVARQLVDSIKTGMAIHKALSKFKENPKKIETPVARPRSPRTIQPSTKHAGEAKCDVLNELLSSFSHIKLKPVHNGKHGGGNNAQPSDEKFSERNADRNSNATSFEPSVADSARNNQVPTESSQISRVTQRLDESSEKPDRFRVESSFETESGSPASLGRYTEVVKVDVHRSELGDDEDNESRASRSMLETRVEPQCLREYAEKSDTSVESSAASLQVAACSVKTDAKDRRDEELDDRARDNAGPVNEQLDLSRRTGSGAESAIARRIPRPHCNNNDNNRAVTPVAVSDDQSRDTVTITPGRVRSFVKYYEIRREATTDSDSKTNDRDRQDRDHVPGHRSVTSICRGLEAKAIGAKPSESRRDLFHASILDDVESSGPKSKPVITGTPTTEDNWSRSNQPGVEATGDPGSRQEETSADGSIAQSGKVKRKKSVKFQGGHTVIGAKCSQDDGPVGSSASQATKSPRKRKAPDRPSPAEKPSCERTASGEEKESLDTWVFDKRDIAAQIQAAAERGGECSATNIGGRCPRSGFPNASRNIVTRMKSVYPVITANTCTAEDQDSNEATEPVIRLKLDKPLNWEWELTTSADTVPVIQLLDKNGRLLVETTGRTAQRARGSFREGLKSYEEFPTSRQSSEKIPTASSSFSSSSVSSSPAPVQGNRNVDGFSTKFGSCEFGYRPRKSKSDAAVKDRESRGRKRHSVGPDLTRMAAQRNDTGKAKSYSLGDYLRQQIINDLRTRSTHGKCPEEIAKERCKKMKAYLRSQSENLPRLLHVEEEEAGEKSTEEGVRGRRIEDGLKRTREEDRTEAAASICRSETAPTGFQTGIRNEELRKVKAFLQRKLQQKMDQERSASSGRCEGLQEAGKNEIRKRYSDYRQNEKPGGYRARKVRSETSIVGFEADPETLRKDGQTWAGRPDRERSRSRNGRVHAEDSVKQKAAQRRSITDAVPKASETTGAANHRAKLQTRESSGSEKRKLYRKTRSDVSFGQAGSSLDSEQDLENPPRRIRSQDNVDESWRWQERARLDRSRRDSEIDAKEEDFMSRPRWKDLQSELCSFRDCRVCQNSRDCVNPLQQRSYDAGAVEVPRGRPSKDGARTLSDSPPCRPGTSLQENYLVIDREPKDRRIEPAMAKIRVEDRVVGSCNANSPDCGYNTIPKEAFKDYRELYTRSNVKKSDTFKIVDGSEDPEGAGDPSDSKVDEGSLDSFECSNTEGLLTNKSNEDIARDYFKRVYELLKKRQLEARRIQDRLETPGCDDSSSSNYAEKVQKKRPRRRRKERNGQGEEVVTVPPTSGGQDSWRAQTLSLSSDSPGNRRRGYHPQLQPVSTSKRTRPAPPPPPISCKVNAKDINKYFDWPNKENRPGNALNTGNAGNAGNAGTDQNQPANDQATMGSNLSRHNGKGLTGRRTQSSGNLCEPKGKLNSMGKILVPCSSAQRERYKFCGSLPNHLDDQDGLDDDPKENNNIMTDTIAGNLGGTLPHKKRSLGVHFSDGGPTGALDLVKHRSQDSIDENDPWRYQQSDLDLVRCRHGNFDSVRRNRSTDTVSSDSSRRYTRGSSLEDRCHRNSDLDLVGTLPKRKQDTKNSKKPSDINSSSSQPSIPSATDNDLLMQIVHKPDCELVRHRQQLSKCIDLKLSKLAGGEPQDQGYASERSPEDEHPPSLPGQPFPNITPESTFRVTLQKSSRGLGLSVSGGGTAGPVRVKRLFPQQPAALSNKLQPGDILLAANGIPLTGLTNYEALEVLRTTPSTVELVVCRLPGDTTVTPPGAPPPPPARREPPLPLRILTPLPPLQIEPCGEFDIEMTKVGGSLGFTLRKADSSALGHYVRALVREPALSDGRIRPGDKIVAVDGAPLSPMSHEEAVQLLRQCGPTVKLRLYRDLAQTPVSALSPTEPDHPLRPPRTSLRQEAVDMLCDLAVRKLSPGTSSGSSCKQSPGASCNSPRRLRRLATRTPTENDQEALEKHSSVHATSAASQAETSDSDQCSIRTQITNSQPNTPGTDIIDPPPLYDVCDSSDSSKTPARPSFLDLSAPQGKPHFQFCSLDSDLEYPGGEAIAAEGQQDERDETAGLDYERREASVLPTDDHDNNPPSEPASMPPVLSSTSNSSAAAFSYKNPAYQSANPACGAGIDAATKNKATHSSDQDIPGLILGAEDPAGSKGLLKWKGVMFAPDDGINKSENEAENVGKDTTDSAIPSEELEQGSEVFMVELTRGWNSRLGFSLQSEGDHTVISVVHPDSVAAKDGRLKQGDVLLMVNDESVKDMSTADIIDLLRKIRGSIGITVMRQSKTENPT